MIIYVQADLFTVFDGIIAHGVNCVGGFGSGVAGIIAQKYPQVRAKYLEKFNKQGWELGDVQMVPVMGNIKKPIYIANCATQKEYFPRDRVHADYEAIEKCMIKVKEFAKRTNRKVSIPKIGAGLAGGDWKIIEGIINKVFNDYDIYVYYLK